MNRFQLTADRFREELLDDLDPSDDLVDQLKKWKVLKMLQLSDLKVRCIL